MSVLIDVSALMSPVSTATPLVMVTLPLVGAKAKFGGARKFFTNIGKHLLLAVDVEAGADLRQNVVVLLLDGVVGLKLTVVPPSFA